HFQTSILPIFISSMVIMAGCSGPAPAPQPQPKVEQTQQHASDLNRPSDVDRPPAAVEESVKPVERPRAVATAAPKPKLAAKESPRTAPAPQQADGRANPATAATQTANNGSTAPGTLTLPAPTAPPVAVPA